MSHSQHWQQHIDAWQQSSGSQAQYCRQHELDQSQFSYWKRKLIKTSNPKSVKPSRFAVAQVAVMPEPASSLPLACPMASFLAALMPSTRQWRRNCWSTCADATDTATQYPTRSGVFVLRPD